MQVLKMHLVAIAATCFAAALLLVALPVQAAPRVQTITKSCVSIQTTLIENGAAILRYPAKRNPSLTLYDRYVGDSRFCQSNEIGKWASVPAKDTRSCRVIACQKFQPDDFFDLDGYNGVFLRLRISN